MRAILFVVACVIGFSAVGHAADKVVLPSPLKAANHGITIFDYQKDLGLSDKQVADIKAATTALQTTLAERAQEITTLRQDINAMIASNERIERIREKLQKISTLQIDNACLDIETVRKVEATLTPSQMIKWQEIQAKNAAKPKALKEGKVKGMKQGKGGKAGKAGKGKKKKS